MIGNGIHAQFIVFRKHLSSLRLSLKNYIPESV